MSSAGVLFDLDGTLLDTAPEFATCLNILLKQENKLPISVEQLRPFVSFGAKGMLEFGFELTEKDPQFGALKQRFLDLYHSDLGFQTHFFPGILKLLEFIQDQQLPWGIVTNKPKLYTHSLVEKFVPLNLAQCVIAGDTLTVSKPDPAPLLHACKMLKIDPKDCWYIGDAKTDVEAGQRAGMKTAIAYYGYIPQNEDPLDWKADYYLSDPSEITDLLS